MKGEPHTSNLTEICADQRRVESAAWCDRSRSPQGGQGREQGLSEGWEPWGSLTSIEKEQELPLGDRLFIMNMTIRSKGCHNLRVSL